MLGWILAAAVAAAPAPAGAPQEPQSVWQSLEGGSVEHLQSGLTCPATLGASQRYNYKTYDGFGLDVGCGWNTDNATFTVYLTRRPDTAAAFEEAKQQLVGASPQRHPRPLAEGRATLGGTQWRRADYAFDGGLRSEIWISNLRGWVLKYRVSYRETDGAEAAKTLEAMTAHVMSTAGARLDLCAKSQVPVRPGKPAKARRSGADNTMAALLGGVAAMAAQDKGEAPVPITFCVEGPAERQDMDFLAWRGVTPDGEDAHVDRLTGMTVGPPPVLEIALDEMGGVVAAELSGKDVERWQATVTQNREVLIFGHFEGRPSTTLAVDLMARILKGKARSIGSYSLDGKTINVVVPE